jgi:hypothetical protein
VSKYASTTDPWHYPRPELAQKYLQVFDIGLVSARGLFAKRRMGKSEFLEQDLVPAAQALGYLTVCLNMWDARANPTPALVAALGSAMQPKGFSKLAKTLNTPLKKVKASAKVTGLAEGSLEAELTDNAAVFGPRLSELLRGFDKPGKRMLLVLDEAQVLADPKHTELAHSLRAALDSRKQNIKVVFAGSSEPTLRRMFGRSTEPFYNWAPLEPFELLGPEFVEAMIAKVKNLSKYPMTKNDGLIAYAALKNTPEFFRRYLERYLSYAELGPQAALEYTQAHVFSDANFLAVWEKLRPADKEVLKLLASGATDLYSESARKQLGAVLGKPKPVDISTPQNSLRRLQDEELVLKLDYGTYQLQDDAFAEWLRNLELDT